MNSPEARDGSDSRKSLGLWDAISLVVGIIIGVGIFQTPPDVFAKQPEFIPAILPWILGSVISLLGALCFAELASTYPRSGGEYVYLSRAFGPSPLVGFLYAWAQLLLIRPASIGALAYVSALYLGKLLDNGDSSLLLALAIAAIVGLTAINILGVRLGATVQNVLTVLKILGLAAIVVVGLAWGKTERVAWTGPIIFDKFAGTMVLVLWTYDGWNEAAYVASEVKDARRNLPLSLLLGTLIVTAIYLLVNVALLFGLGSANAMKATAVADLMSLAWPAGGSRVMSVIILVSALGALNGTIFTTARICAAFGTDHALFSVLDQWHPRFKTPVVALVAESAISTLLTIAVLTPVFSFVMESLFGWIDDIDILPWTLAGSAVASASDPFEKLVDITAAIFWMTFLLTGLALFVLRFRDRDIQRPFRVPGYPVVPILFCACCGYMAYGSISYAPTLSTIGVGVTVLGVPIFYLSGSHRPRPGQLARRELDQAIREEATSGL
jgi:basic amino acid/polyamine antiporter, APA family